MNVGVRSALALAISVCVLALAAAESPAPSSADPATRAAMHEIFDALATILPHAVASNESTAPADRAALRSAFDTIAARADSLRTHSGASDAGFAFLGESLAADAREAKRRFDGGQYFDARFEAAHLVDACIACHSRLPSDHDAPFAQKLVAGIDAAKLPVHDRARLAIATRQFDTGLDLYEGLLLSPPPPDGDGARARDLVEYLIVAVRVKRDPARAAKLLTALQQRAATPEDTKRQIGPWLQSLKKNGHALDEAPSLARARSLVDAARRAREVPFSRSGLVDDLLASAILHQLVAQPGLATHDRAEAYYLLGITDAQVRSSPWLSDAARYLETAIRTEPHSPLAQRAFDVYEDMTLLEWTGAISAELPEDVRLDLDRLRALAAPAPAK
ncbi:MAG TPA: hypothetical protein VMR50_22255 [Myxococcota bacterium]|nr:hypothetical protein [Myxococcota bacterium]